MDLVFSSPLFRSFIGYDDLFKELEVVLASKDNSSYPPFNVWSVKPTQQDVAETTYVELAVAGFKKTDLEVHLENNVLTVKGQKQNNTPVNGYRGIAKRDFVRQFRVGQKYIVHSAKLEDGILTIRLDLPLSKKLETRIEIQ
jgi:molecular chaperone IbpA